MSGLPTGCGHIVPENGPFGYIDKVLISGIIYETDKTVNSCVMGPALTIPTFFRGMKHDALHQLGQAKSLNQIKKILKNEHKTQLMGRSLRGKAAVRRHLIAKEIWPFIKKWGPGFEILK